MPVSQGNLKPSCSIFGKTVYLLSFGKLPFIVETYDEGTHIYVRFANNTSDSNKLLVEATTNMVDSTTSSTVSSRSTA